MPRPDKEDQPFGEDMTDAEVKRILSLPALKVINKEKSSGVARLEKILKIHSRVMRYEPKGIVIREGDYGNSAFFVMSGEVCVAWGIPPESLGRRTLQKKNFWQALSQLWSNSKIPEKRDIS